jgi:hypothetical protein
VKAERPEYKQLAEHRQARSWPFEGSATAEARKIPGDIPASTHYHGFMVRNE